MWARMSVLSDVKEGGASAAVSQPMRCFLFFGLGMMLCWIRIVLYGARADVGLGWLLVVLRYRFCLRIKNDNAARGSRK